MKKIKESTQFEHIYLCYIKFNLMLYASPSRNWDFWFDSPEKIEPINTKNKSFTFAFQMSGLLFFPMFFLIFDYISFDSNFNFLGYYTLYIILQTLIFYYFNKKFDIERLSSIVNYVVARTKITYWEAEIYTIMFIILFSVIFYLTQKFAIFIFNYFFTHLF